MLNQHIREDTTKVRLLNELSYQNIGVNYFMAREYAEKALRLSEKISYLKGIANSNNRLAIASWSLGENDVAIEYALRAVELIKQENLGSEMLAESYRALGFAYLDLQELTKSGFYLHELEKIALKKGNQKLLFRSYVGLTRLKFFQKQVDSAAYFEKKCSEVLKDLKDPFSESLLRYLNATSINDPKLAVVDLLKTLNFARNAGNKQVETMSLMMLGANFLKEKNYAEAEKYMLHGLQLSRAIGVKNLTIQNYQLLESLKRQQGRFEEAMVYQKDLYELADSIANGRRTRQVIELEMRYEKEKKEHQIKLLALRTNILIAALALIIILFVALYYFQLFRQRKNLAILNLQIDNLTGQHKELSMKYKGLLASDLNKPIESNDQRLLKEAIEIVENHISDSLFGVDQMAREIGMSRTNLHRKLKAITEFGPSDLIRNIRLRKAATLLLHQKDSVSQIGFQVGFEDHSYFSKSFKKQFGVPPSEYLQFIKKS